MANYNQQDINQTTGSIIQQMMKKGPVIAYDMIKFVFNFINQMIRMVMGE